MTEAVVRDAIGQAFILSEQVWEKSERTMREHRCRESIIADYRRQHDESVRLQLVELAAKLRAEP